MKKIKIAQLITRLDKGGSAEIVFHIAQNLDKSKYEVTLVSGKTVNPIEKLSEYKTEGQFKLIYLDKLRREASPLGDFLAMCELFAVLKKKKFDIVHTHTSKVGILGRFAAFAAGVPIVVHNPHGHIFYEGFYLGHARVEIFKLLERLATKFSDKIITLSDIEKDDYIRLGFGKQGKFTTIHSGVDLERVLNSVEGPEKIKKEFGIPEGSPVIGNVAYLVPRKGHKYLIDAVPIILKKIPDAVFIMVGDGELRQELVMQARDLGVSDKIIFTGWRRDIPRILNIFDVFVFPSVSEGMGMALVEAMAAKKPVVASSVMGIKEIVKDGITGLLVPPADSQKLADAIVDILKDKTKATQFGENALKYVDPDFRLETMMSRLEALYAELISEKLAGRDS